MRKHNCNIGFNDGLLMFISIPLLSFVIPFVFMGCRFNSYPFFGLDTFITTLCITTILWFGSRAIMIYSRKMYPLFKDVKRRLTLQCIILFLFTIIFNNVLGYFFDCFIFIKERDRFGVDTMISTNSAAIFCTIMIIAIYESIFFMHQLRYSVEEQETLKRENLNAQLEALRTQVNPHFLFNNLNTLSSLIPENPNHAVQFVQQLSKVYRYILEVNDAKTITLSDELDVVNAYCFLLKTRFENNLAINIDIPKEKMHKKIVPLSLQLLIENAVKHNIVSSDKPLLINISSSNGSIEVDNNLQMKRQIMESTGIGLDNIRNRYKLLSTQLVKVTETENSFTVSIPLIEN